MSDPRTHICQEVVDQVNRAVGELYGLHTTIMLMAHANPAFGKDAGIDYLYWRVGELVQAVPPMNASAYTIPEVVTITEQEVVPSYLDVVDELQSLWRDARDRVVAGGTSNELVADYKTRCESEEESPLAKFDAALYRGDAANFDTMMGL